VTFALPRVRNGVFFQIWYMRRFPARRLLAPPGAGGEPGQKESVSVQWWHRYLLDPWQALAVLGRWAALVAAVAAVAWLAAWVRRARTRKEAARRARWVEIHPPGEAAPEDGERFWRAMARLLRRRYGGWAPHVVFELVWAGPRLTLGVWVPGGVPAFQVKRIAETS